MAKLNDNNFLIWDGQFNNTPFDVIATNDAVNMVVNALSIDINVLVNDIATYGVDKPSLEITLQDNPAKLATYNQVSGIVTYYPPAGVQVGQVRQLKYRWYDKAGHVSNEGTINITITDRAFGWRGYGPSYRCLKDGDNNNTGQGFYDTLEKYYTDNNTPYSPATLKNNTFGQADYIPASTDLTTCPLPSATVSLYVWNYIPNAPSITIDSVTFKKAGDPDKVYAVNNTGSVGFQPSQFQTQPDAVYDSMEVKMTIVNVAAAGEYNLLFTPGDGGGGGFDQLVNFPAVAGSVVVAVFPNVTTGTLFAGEITLST